MTAKVLEPRRPKLWDFEDLFLFFFSIFQAGECVSPWHTYTSRGRMPTYRKGQPAYPPVYELTMLHGGAGDAYDGLA